jgi:hypothetical protein
MTGRRRTEQLLLQAVAVLLLAVVVVVVVRSQLSSSARRVTHKTVGQEIVAATQAPFAQPPTGAVLGGPIEAFDALYGPRQSDSIGGDGTATYLAALEGVDLQVAVRVATVSTGRRILSIALQPAPTPNPSDPLYSSWDAITAARLVTHFEPPDARLLRVELVGGHGPSAASVRRIYQSMSLVVAYGTARFRDEYTGTPIGNGYFATVCRTIDCLLQPSQG